MNRGGELLVGSPGRRHAHQVAVDVGELHDSRQRQPELERLGRGEGTCLFCAAGHGCGYA